MLYPKRHPLRVPSYGRDVRDPGTGALREAQQRLGQFTSDQPRQPHAGDTSDAIDSRHMPRAGFARSNPFASASAVASPSNPFASVTPSQLSPPVHSQPQAAARIGADMRDLSWACAACTIVNNVSEPRCTMCGTVCPPAGSSGGALSPAQGDRRSAQPSCGHVPSGMSPFASAAEASVMLGRDHAGSGHAPGAEAAATQHHTPPPIAYAIVNDKTPQDVAFFERHEGVHMLTWDTQGGADYGGFDRLLKALYTRTSPDYTLGAVIAHKRILVVQRPDPPAGSGRGSEAPRTPQAAAATVSNAAADPRGLAAMLTRALDAYAAADPDAAVPAGSASNAHADVTVAVHSRQPINRIRVVTSLDAARAEFRGGVAVTEAASTAAGGAVDGAFDAIVTDYGPRGQGPVPLWRSVVDCMRSSGAHASAPVIVYSSRAGFEERRRECLRYGCFDVAADFVQLVSALRRLLEEGGEAR
jgi:hypothetical protein